MITKIRDNLYLSGQDDVNNEMRRFGITAVLNVADNSMDPYYRGTEILMCKVGLEDNNLNPNHFIDLALIVLEFLLNNGHVVLVHCVAGASRSPYIIARYLAKKENKNVRDVLIELKSIRQEVFLEPVLL